METSSGTGIADGSQRSDDEQNDGRPTRLFASVPLEEFGVASPSVLAFADPLNLQRTKRDGETSVETYEQAIHEAQKLLGTTCPECTGRLRPADSDHRADHPCWAMCCTTCSWAGLRADVERRQIDHFTAEVPGVGLQTVTRLADEIGTVTEVLRANTGRLAQVRNMSSSKATRLQEHLRENLPYELR